MDYNLNNKPAQVTPDQSPKKPSRMWIYVCIALIGGFFLSNGFFFWYVWTFDKPFDVNNYQQKETALINNTSEWKTYTPEDNYFSVDWPPNWTIDAIGDHAILLSGVGGSFNIAWEGLGGMCDEDKIKQVTLGEDFYWICDQKADGSYYSASVSKTSNHDIGIGIIPVYTSIVDADKVVFLRVLKSIQLHSLAEIVTGGKTYTNSEYGFELKYPANWIVKMNVQDKDALMQFIAPNTQLLMEANAQACSDKDNATECNPDGTPVDVNLSVTSKDAFNITEPNGTATFNNITFTKYLGAFAGEQHFITTYDGHDFDITCINMNMCSQILSTFTFINTANNQAPDYGDKLTTFKDEPITFSTSDLSVNIFKKESLANDIMRTPEDAKACNITFPDGYLQNLDQKFMGAKKTVYTIVYIDPGFYRHTYAVALLPNKMNYASLTEANKDFFACGVGGFFPYKINQDWIVFSMGCGGVDEGCGTIQDVVNPTIKFTK